MLGTAFYLLLHIQCLDASFPVKPLCVATQSESLVGKLNWKITSRGAITETKYIDTKAEKRSTTVSKMGPDLMKIVSFVLKSLTIFHFHPLSVHKSPVVSCDWLVVAGWNCWCIINGHGGGWNGGIRVIVLLQGLSVAAKEQRLFFCLSTFHRAKKPSFFPSLFKSVIFFAAGRVVFSCLSFVRFLSLIIKFRSWGLREIHGTETEAYNARTVIKASLILCTLLHHLHTATTRASLILLSDGWTSLAG